MSHQPDTPNDGRPEWEISPGQQQRFRVRSLEVLRRARELARTTVERVRAALTAAGSDGGRAAAGS